MAPPRLMPFWRYYGGKFRAAPHYPAPVHKRIIEPFAGAAGYSLRWHEREVVLLDKYAVVCEIWRTLIAISPAEVLRIPTVDAVEDLPAWVPEGMRLLVGFRMNSATTSPCKTLSAGSIKLRAMGRRYEGWSENAREMVARQVSLIRHWRIIEGDYHDSPSGAATRFVDPPYSGAPGRRYVHNAIDFAQLGAWCTHQRGQTIVCENAGASWLPFRPFMTIKAGPANKVSREVIWTNHIPVNPAGDQWTTTPR